MDLRKIIVGKQELRELKWWDIAAVTLIMFGQAIYTSTMQWLTLKTPGVSEAIEFTASDNLEALRSQLILLALGLLYLRIRQFDFSQWKIKITPKHTVYAIALFVAGALTLDLFMFAAWNVFPQGFAVADAATQAVGEAASAAPTMLEQMNLTTILYAALNGFYEEIYFIGMCMFVAPKKVKYAFLFSLLIRFSFHTYQGIFPAIGITLLGVVYYVWFRKTKGENLYPFFLSHAIADVFGLTIMAYLWR